MPKPYKYGMMSSTIRYWQHEARRLWQTNAIVLGRRTFEPYPADAPDYINIYSSRYLAHHAIACAAILKPHELRQLFQTGTYSAASLDDTLSH